MMKTNPLISIILPFYNEEKYLDFCLSSLINQTYKNIEIIAIDDGSTDSSIAIAKKYDVKLLRQKHKGAGAARNVGVVHAKGEILVFADADMKYDKDYVFYLIQPIIKDDVAGTFTKEEYVANPDNIWSKCWSINAGLPFNRRLPLNYRNQENAFRAMQKQYFMKANGFSEEDGYNDDSSISRKIHIFAQNAPGAICYHYNPSSIKEIFYSSRWIGRSSYFSLNFQNFLRYTPINSLRIATKFVLQGASLQMYVFKIVYDCGMFVGIFLRHGKREK